MTGQSLYLNICIIGANKISVLLSNCGKPPANSPGHFYPKGHFAAVNFQIDRRELFVRQDWQIEADNKNKGSAQKIVQRFARNAGLFFERSPRKLSILIA